MHKGLARPIDKDSRHSSSLEDHDRDALDIGPNHHAGLDRFDHFKIDRNSVLGVLLKAKYLILVAALIGGLYSVFVRWSNPVLYRSTAVVQVWVNENSPTDSPVSLMYISPSVRIILQQATSTRMYDHLIKKFDLKEHYGINPIDPYNVEKAYTILDKRVLVRMNDENTVSIEVSDPTAAFAAQMANAIAQDLQDFSKKEEDHQLNTLELVYSMLRTKNRERSTSLSDQFAQVLNTGLSNANAPEEVREVQLQIATLMSQMRSSEDDLRRNSEYYEVLQTVGGKLKQPKVHLLRRAMRDIRTSTLWISARTLTLSMITSVMLCVFGIILWHLHGTNVIHSLTKEEVHPSFGRSGNSQHQMINREHERQ